MYKTNLKTAMSILLITVALMTQAQSTLIVDNNANAPTGTYESLSDAYTAAAAGDTIYIQPSATSYGSLSNIEKELHFVGGSYDSDAGYQSEVSGLFFKNNSSNSSVKGLYLNSLYLGYYNDQNIENFLISECRIISANLGYYNYSNVLTSSVLFQGNLVGTLYVGGPTQSSDILIRNNVIASNLTSHNSETVITKNIFSGNGRGLYNNASSGTLNISDCIFINNSDTSSGSYNMYLDGHINLSNCLTYNYYSGSDYIFYEDTTDTIVNYSNMLYNTDPLFTNINTAYPSLFSGSYASPSDDLHLQTTSPAIDAGVAGDDLGIFSGYNFSWLGYPPGVPSITIDSYTGTVPKNGNISVTLSAEAH